MFFFLLLYLDFAYFLNLLLYIIFYIYVFTLVTMATIMSQVLDACLFLFM